MQKLLEQREALREAFKDWDGTPRLADGFLLPWSAYT